MYKLYKRLDTSNYGSIYPYKNLQYESHYEATKGMIKIAIIDGVRIKDLMIIEECEPADVLLDTNDIFGGDSDENNSED